MVDLYAVRSICLFIHVHSRAFLCLLSCATQTQVAKKHQKTHPKICGHLRHRGSFVMASLRLGLFFLTAPCSKLAGVCAKINQYCTIFTGQALWTIELRPVPNPKSKRRTLTHHHETLDYTGPENTWNPLNRECYTVILSYPSIPTITQRLKPPRNGHTALFQPLLLWACHPGHRKNLCSDWIETMLGIDFVKLNQNPTV